MFFSRRIGLTEDRRPVPIIGGAKVTGRAAGLDLGFLSVQTDDFEGTPGSNYTVFRAKKNILARSNVGLFASNRQASGDDYNRVFGADANFTIFKNTDIQGFIGRSDHSRAATATTRSGGSSTTGSATSTKSSSSISTSATTSSTTSASCGAAESSAPTACSSGSRGRSASTSAISCSAGRSST